jgi:hypothetical protein
MLKKYLLLVLISIVLISSNFVLAAANIIGQIKTDNKDAVEVEWKWNNQIAGGPPFNLITTTVNWSMQTLALTPTRNIKTVVSHINPPHPGEQLKQVSFCYKLGLPQHVVAKAPNISGIAEQCGVSTPHKAHHDNYKMTIVPPQNNTGDWSVTWTGVHICSSKLRGKKSISTNDESSICPIEPPFLPLSLKLISFQSTLIGINNYLSWITSNEINNIGFYLWRAVKNQHGGYKPTLIGELGYSEQVNPEPNENCSTKIQGQLEANNSAKLPKPISAIGNSTESTCYSFTDTSNLSDGTYYYLLEDIGDDGKSTFHCDHIDTATIGQGPAIDLESAINYCKEVTGSNN